MLGFEFLTIGFIILIVALYYILDYVGLVEKSIPLFSGVLPKSPLILAIAVIAIVLTSGIITFETVSEEWEGIGLPTPPTAAVGQQEQYDFPILGFEEDGTVFTDTTYAVHLISAKGTINGRTVDDIYITPAAPFKAGEGDLALLYEFAQSEYDTGIDSLPGAYAGTSTASTWSKSISSGKWVFESVTAEIGDKFYVYGRYENTPPYAVNEYEPFVKPITITGSNPDQGEYALSDNRQRVYKMGTHAVYNPQDTSVAGYTNDADTATPDELMSVNFYSDANNNRTVDTHLYIELTSDMQSRIDSLTISNDDGEFDKYTKLTDTSNLNTDDWRFESAPALTVSTSTMYYAGILPDSLRTANTDKDKVEVEIQYDHSAATNTNKFYIYDVHFGRFGSDFHYDGDNFWINATKDGADAWT